MLGSTAMVARLRDYLVERPEPTLAFVTFDRTGTVKAIWLPWQDEDPARRTLAASLAYEVIKKLRYRPAAAGVGHYFAIQKVLLH